MGVGLFSLAASIAPTYWSYAAVMAIIGHALMTFLTSCNTSIQLSVDPRFRGRVLALYLTVLHGGTALGAPLIGWIGTEYGARWSIAGGGLVVLLATGCALVIVGRRRGRRARNRLRGTENQKASF